MFNAFIAFIVGLMLWFLYHVAWLNFTDDGKIQDAKNKAREEAIEAECRKPVLITTAKDGTKLWRYQDRCYPQDESDIVYFSTAGTKRTYETCSHTGKITNCTTRKLETPNAQ